LRRQPEITRRSNDVPKIHFRTCNVVEKLQEMVLLVLSAVIAFPRAVTSELGFTVAENVRYHRDGEKNYLLALLKKI
jgi:hypothetical protein